MTRCLTCGTDNPALSRTCSRCGAALSEGPSEDAAALRGKPHGARGGGRVIFAMVGLVVLGVGAGIAIRERLHKRALGEKLAWFDRWVERDKQEVGGLWTCLIQSPTPIETFTNATQVEAKVEAAAIVQPKTFADRLRNECLPRGDQVVAAFAGVADVPAEFTTVFEVYKQSLPKLKDGIAAYAQGLEARSEGAELSAKIQAAGAAWHTSSAPTPEGIAFEKFFRCAVPQVSQLKNAQALLQTLADQCRKRYAAAFWKQVAAKCGALVMDVDPRAKASPTYQDSMKRFFESEQRLMAAWDYCARQAKKGTPTSDLSTFLQAFATYGEARVQMVEVAKALGETS